MQKKTKKAAKKKGDRYDKWVSEDNLLVVRAMARDGKTDTEIAKYMGISPATYYRWKQRHFELQAAVSKGKEPYDVEVENALHRRTQGFKVKVKKNFKLKKSKFDPKTGFKVEESEELVVAEDEVYVPADTTAQIFWLTNRKPKAWKRQQTDSDIPQNEEAEARLIEALTMGGDKD